MTIAVRYNTRVSVNDSRQPILSVKRRNRQAERQTHFFFRNV